MILITLSLISLLVGAQSDSVMDVKKAFQENDLREIMDEFPEQLLKVTYPSGASVNFGNELTPTQVKDQPTLEWEAEPDSFYTVLMTDPDAPSRENPMLREVRHWLVVNVKGNDLSTGTVKYEFIGSGPPQDTGLHRYVFIAFKQTEKMEFEDLPFVTNRSRDHRLKESTRALMATYNLKPVAGNFYQAQFDDYVPILQKQLSGY